MRKAKRHLLVGLFVVFGGPPQASETYFGYGLYSYTWIPMLGLQFGHDFGSRSHGFGVRVAASSIFLATQVFVDGYHHFVIDAQGLNAYVGVGGGAAFIAAGTVVGQSSNWFVHGLLGIAGPLGSPGSNATWFVEVMPGGGCTPVRHDPTGPVPARTDFHWGFSVGFNSYSR